MKLSRCLAGGLAGRRKAVPNEFLSFNSFGAHSVASRGVKKRDERTSAEGNYRPSFVESRCPRQTFAKGVGK